MEVSGKVFSIAILDKDIENSLTMDHIYKADCVINVDKDKIVCVKNRYGRTEKEIAQKVLDIFAKYK